MCWRTFFLKKVYVSFSIGTIRSWNWSLWYLFSHSYSATHYPLEAEWTPLTKHSLHWQIWCHPLKSNPGCDECLNHYHENLSLMIKIHIIMITFFFRTYVILSLVVCGRLGPWWYVGMNLVFRWKFMVDVRFWTLIRTCYL